MSDSPLTICVGGVSLGGVGKTQVIQELAWRATQLDLSVAVLCHAYRGAQRSTPQRLKLTPRWGDLTWGDEAAMLRRWLPPSVQLWCGGSWRAKWDAARREVPEVILCDGGLYTRDLPRHIGIVTLSSVMRSQLIPLGDSTRPQSMWPRGPGYLWWWIHHSTSVDDRGVLSHQAARTMSELMKLSGVEEAFSSYVEALEWINRARGAAPLTTLSRQDAGLICAIARPSRFVNLVERGEVRVTRAVIARDHAPLDHRLKRLLKRERGSRGLPLRWVTTLKDLVKLSPELDERFEIWGLRVGITAPTLYRAVDVTQDDPDTPLTHR